MHWSSWWPISPGQVVSLGRTMGLVRQHKSAALGWMHHSSLAKAPSAPGASTQASQECRAARRVVWVDWQNSSCSKESGFGGEVGNTVQQDARFARKFLVLTHKTQYSCTFLLHLRKQCWCQGTSSDPNRVMSKGRMLMRAEMQ